MQPQQPADATALTYRMNGLEKDIQHLQTQLTAYVPARENELQLASIRSTVERIERDVQDTKKEVTGLNDKLSKQKEAQDNVIIKVLWGVVATFISGAMAVVVYFITHPGGRGMSQRLRSALIRVITVCGIVLLLLSIVSDS